MRKAFVETLEKMAEADDRIMFLTGDLGYQMFEPFKEKFPGRYINCGVAEANMVCVAAGLASEGKRPICYSIGSFMTSRPFEQIKLMLAYHKLPVILIGAGGGYAYASSGPTHHSADDFALMMLIPGMDVIAPGTPQEIRELLPQLVEFGRPSYMRIGKFGEPDVTMEPARLQHMKVIRDSPGDTLVISIGEMLPAVLDAWEILYVEGHNLPSVWHCHSLRPFDYEMMTEALMRYRSIVVVEESLPDAAFNRICSVVACRTARLARMFRIGPYPGIVLGNPSRESLRYKEGMTPAKIADKLKAIGRLDD